jgi:hypothetical protein
MSVRVLGRYGYRGRFDQEWDDHIADPTWADIEAALSRLDAGEFAGVVLHQDGYSPGDPATAAFSVTGGPDGYLVTCPVPGGGGRRARLINPNVPDGGPLVGVCRRDQGVWVPERWVCRHFPTVVAAARHWAGAGHPWPDAVWG